MALAAEVARAMGASPAGSIVAKATLTLALALAITRFAHKSCAALRQLLLAAAFAVLLLLPFASMVAPAMPLLTASISSGGGSESYVPASSSGPARWADRVGVPSDGPAATPSPRVPAFALLWAVWAAGAVLFLLPVLLGLRRAPTLRLGGRQWPHGHSVVRQMAVRLGIHRRVDLLLCDRVSGPASFGFVRPVVLLPVDARTWDEDDLGRAIVHELEHVRRNDWASHCLVRAVCACYWFHPLVWVAWRRLALEAERACDDAVLRHAEATVYADQLVRLAERMSTGGTRPLPAMANRTELATRVVAVLDSGQRRGPAGAFSRTLVCVASAALLFGISPLRIAAAASGTAPPSFSGALLDPLGRSLPDRRLTLWRGSTPQPVEGRTDRSGRFVFARLPAGEYRVHVHGFGPQGRITVAPAQHLKRDIPVVMPGGDYELTISSTDAPTLLPPLPRAMPLPAKTSLKADRAALARCAEASLFCRVTPPVPIARAQPNYPAREREHGIGGTVVVEGRVAADGLIKDLHAVESSDPDFTDATVDALRRWQFQPMRFDDVPVEMTIRVSADFVVR